MTKPRNEYVPVDLYGLRVTGRGITGRPFDFSQATITLLQPYLDKVLTITADNGKEFAGHEEMAEKLNASVYFALPYHSWERGLNENTNGLIRQYFTKGSSFENITDEAVANVMHKLNHRPRKILDYKTPHSVFFEKSETA